MSGSSAVSSSQPKDIAQLVGEFDKLCEEYLIRKAPFAIPENWKDIIVKVMPWLNVVGIVLSLLALPVLLGAGAIVTTLGIASGATINPLSNIWGILTLAFTLLGLGISIMAAQGLFHRKASAWRLMFYAQLVNAIQGLVGGNPIGMLVSLVIGMYVLYQVRSKFSN